MKNTLITKATTIAALLVALTLGCAGPTPPDAEAIASSYISSEGRAIRQQAAATIAEHTKLPGPIADQLMDHAMEATMYHACAETTRDTDVASVECMVWFEANIGFEIEAEAPFLVTVDLDTGGNWAAPQVTDNTLLVNRVTVNGESLKDYRVPQIGLQIPSFGR